MSDILVFTATYNERENINNLVNDIFQISSEIDMLVIDDNSPDETWKILKKISEKNKRFFFIKRDKKNFDVVLLTANNNYRKLIQQAKEFKVRNVIINNNTWMKTK